MNAKCITVRYEAGEYYLKNGVKGGATYGFPIRMESTIKIADLDGKVYMLRQG